MTGTDDFEVLTQLCLDIVHMKITPVDAFEQILIQKVSFSMINFCKKHLNLSETKRRDQLGAHRHSGAHRARSRVCDESKHVKNQFRDVRSTDNRYGEIYQ